MYLRDSTSDLYDSYDEKLFPIIDKVKSQNISDKQFYTIHLMGSHTSYDRRSIINSNFNINRNRIIKEKDYNNYYKKNVNDNF